MSASIQKISATEFIKQLESEAAPLVIDVRTSAEVANESFDGSVNMPLHVLKTEQVESCLKQQSAQHKPVYLLCGTGKRAATAAEKISSKLPNDVWVVEGGIEALKLAGCPVSQAKEQGNLMSLERQVRITAGLLVVLGVVLGAFIAPAFYILSAGVGAGLVFAGVTDSCMMGMLLARMPWNSAR